MKQSDSREKNVLVAVLKRKDDLDILLGEHWYRIPAAQAPKRKFRYLAFYEPACFGRRGKRVKYYAPVLSYKIERRKKLLPREADHPKAEEEYVKIRVGKISQLPRHIRNVPPRRMIFNFTTLRNLLTAKNILQLYRVAPTEQIMYRALKQGSIKTIPQHYFCREGKRYRLDFAVYCRKGKIAIECDNLKAHFGKRQIACDKAKDIFLRKHGWKVMRFREREIVSDVESCIAKVWKFIKKFGGRQFTQG